MAIFNSKLLVYQRVNFGSQFRIHPTLDSRTVPPEIPPTLRLKSGHEGLRLGFHLGLKLQELGNGEGPGG